MNARQIIDRNKCIEMDAQGEEQDCQGCSCSVCLADEGELLHAAEIGRAIIWAQENRYAQGLKSSYAFIDDFGRVAYNHYNDVLEAYRKSKEAHND